MKNDVNLKELVTLLKAKGLTVGFVESCTGGRLSADLTTVSGSSEVVRGSLVCYQIEAKQQVLGLDWVNENNVVLAATASHMAEAAQQILDTDVTIATTGYLEPGSTKGTSILDPGKEATGPHAYWAILGPFAENKSVFDPEWQRVDFDAHQTRDENREFLIQEVFRTLWKAAEGYTDV